MLMVLPTPSRPFPLHHIWSTPFRGQAWTMAACRHPFLKQQCFSPPPKTRLSQTKMSSGEALIVCGVVFILGHSAGMIQIAALTITTHQCLIVCKAAITRLIVTLQSWRLDCDFFFIPRLSVTKTQKHCRIPAVHLRGSVQLNFFFFFFFN